MLFKALNSRRLRLRGKYGHLLHPMESFALPLLKHYLKKNSIKLVLYVDAVCTPAHITNKWHVADW